MEERKRLLELIKHFEKICIDFSTGEKITFEAYESARNDMLAEPQFQQIIPEWVIKNRYGSQFWQYIKKVSSHYEGRRKFLWGSFAEMDDALNSGKNEPITVTLNEVLGFIERDEFHKLWKKIHYRKGVDPEGAITAAKTLLETTLQHILKELGEPFSSKEDLPDLYQKVAKRLHLSPEAEHEKSFKGICSGISTIVLGIGTLRNKYGDAHGKIDGRVAPSKRHVDLAVNLSGTLCSFLLETMKAETRKISIPNSAS